MNTTYTMSGPGPTTVARRMRIGGLRTRAFAASAALAVTGVLLLPGCAQRSPPPAGGPVADWRYWGGNEAGQRYSPLAEVTPANVRGLHVAWTYRIGVAPVAPEHPSTPEQARKLLAAGRATEQYRLPALEVTPIVAEGRLYACSGTNRVVALDPESGRELWAFDPKLDTRGLYLMNCRGVSYWHDAKAAADASCASRILTGTADGRLIALDARSGRPCDGFGAGGAVDLRADLGRNEPGDYSVSSAPAIVGDLVIVGGRIEDTFRTDMPAGVIRAYDLRSGALAWAWNPLPPGRSDAEAKGDDGKYLRATTNAWSTFSVDSARGLVFVPTGNVQMDLYGGDRGGPGNGKDYYSSSVVALEAATGRVVWHFQTVHHDVWDYDVPAQPVLFDMPTPAGPVAALAQATKQGYIFILDRATGVPLVPVVERAVPQAGKVPGEYLSPTQPAPAVEGYVLRRPDLTEDDMWGFTPWDKGKCRELFRAHRHEGAFAPPSLEGTVTFPNNMGVMNWGSIAIDPVRKLLLVNTTHIGTITTLIPRAEADSRIARGEVLLPQIGAPYAALWQPMLSPFGAPCNRPPWGEIVAIDLTSGKRAWTSTLGTTRDLAPFPLWLKLGTPNIGGPLVTASGLTFIGAATDSYLRAFDTVSGEEIWKGRLPAGGQATPMSYRVRPDGRQFVVIAAGGHSFLGAKPGDYIVAFTL